MKSFLSLLIFTFYVAVTGVSAKESPYSTNGENVDGRRTYGNFVPKIQNTFQVYEGQRISLAEVNGDRVAAGVDFFSREMRVEKNEIKIASHHTSKHNGVTHVYLQQVINGIKVLNGVANINILKTGELHSSGNSFYSGQRLTEKNVKPRHAATDAVQALAKLLDLETSQQFTEDILTESEGVNEKKIVHGLSLAKNDVPAVLKYLQTNDGLRLVWDIEIELEENFYNGFVDGESNIVLSLIDLVSDASYNVQPFGKNDPRDGPRELVVNPENEVASPNGWHSQGGETEVFTDTIGNNVYAQENHDGNDTHLENLRPDGGVDLIFDFPMDLVDHPLLYTDASTTQLFYMNNMIHDVFYMYGFTEDAGNFQEVNFEFGEGGGDAVIANAQDGSGVNNANFLTLPDGSTGRMRMYIFDTLDPDRDAVFDTTIVIHEYLHGISNRLTGGRTNHLCLPENESGGMGEGWGDIFGTMFRMNETTTRDAVYVVGDYVSGVGSRNFPYSTDMNINPLTYGFVILPAYEGVHAKGTVWATMLYEVYWNLVEKHGFDSNWFNTDASENPDGLRGNVIFAQLLIDGMKIQPCQPNFIQARDAIIEADIINNNGDNFEEIWAGFAKRGLGVDARFPGVQSFTSDFLVTTPLSAAPKTLIMQSILYTTVFLTGITSFIY